MVTLLLDSTRLEVVLSATERALAFHKGNVIIPRETIAKVQLIDDPWTWVRGIQSPGTRLPGVIAMGTWKSVNGEDFVIVRRRRPGVVIDLEGHPEFDRVVLTTRHGLALVQSLHVDAGEQPADVVDLATGAVATDPARPAKKTPAKPKAAPKSAAAAKKPAASTTAAASKTASDRDREQAGSDQARREQDRDAEARNAQDVGREDRRRSDSRRGGAEDRSDEEVGVRGEARSRPAEARSRPAAAEARAQAGARDACRGRPRAGLRPGPGLAIRRAARRRRAAS